MRLSFVGDWAPVESSTGLQNGGLAIGNLECAFADDEIASEKA